MDPKKAFAEIITGESLHDGELAVMVFTESRADLADHLKLAVQPSPCGKAWKNRITGQTEFEHGCDSEIVDVINEDEVNDQRIAEFCLKADDMASVKVERIEDGKLMTLVVIALV